MRLLNQTYKVLEIWIYTKLDDQILIYSIGWVGGGGGGGSISSLNAVFGSNDE